MWLPVCLQRVTATATGTVVSFSETVTEQALAAIWMAATFGQGCKRVVRVWIQNIVSVMTTASRCLDGDCDVYQGAACTAVL